METQEDLRSIIKILLSENKMLKQKLERYNGVTIEQNNNDKLIEISHEELLNEPTLFFSENDFEFLDEVNL